MSLSPYLLSPRGIAIVGASGDITRFGGQTVRALNTSGYTGGVYPVNPKYGEIDGRRSYASVAAIDGPCDLAVIALPAAHVAGVVAECGRKGIGHAVVLGGGFREIGPEGERLEQEMLAAARAGGVRLIGPNCIGLVNVHANVVAAFGSLTRPPKLQPGGVSVAVQSGGFGMSVVIQAAMAGVGFRHVVATGSESDITMPELLDHYVDDPQTKVIFAYIEGVADGRALMAALDRALEAGKPVVVWKAGKTGQGARAAASHTANLTSTYAVYRAALRQCGVVEVSSAEQVVDFLVGQSGGSLQSAGMAQVAQPSWPARVLGEAAVRFDKPVFAVSAVPASISSVGHEFFAGAGIPLLSSPNRAAQVMGQLADFAQARARHAGTRAAPQMPASLAQHALPAGDVALDEHEGKALLRAAGIPVTADVRIPLDSPLLREGLGLAGTGADGERIPFPIALKLLSRDIAHKSDIGGVRLGIQDVAALAEAGRAMLARAREAVPGARLGGLLACPMVEGGIEAIVGVVDDETFGPVVALGLGGVFAETLKDVVFRIAPFGLDEAQSMVAELRGSALFDGQRGRPPADREALAEVLVQVSALAWSLRGRLSELDINPLIVRSRGEGVVAVDALAVLRA